MTSPPTTLLCQYRYDPLDRLVHQTQPDTTAHQRFYCKSRLATEIHGATTHSIIQHDDLLMAEQQREGDVLDTTLLVTDLQRSVLHTLKKGVLPRTIAYSPYGHRPVFSVQLSLLGFNGERPDPVTGCYLLGNGYRAFNPVLMRFNTPDSWSPYGKGGINSYAYCLGDPTNKSDRSGQAARSIIFPISRLKILARRAIKRTSRRSGMAYDGGTSYAGKFRQGFQIKKGVSIDQAYSAIDQLQQLDEITGQRYITEKLYDSHRRNPD
jgi:RHS repeat-associated protein